MFNSRRRSALPEVTVVAELGEHRVFEGRYECGVFWFDAVDGAYAIQYAGSTGRIIRGLRTEADAIRTLLGR
jgi:hypothetical protein